MATEYSLGDVVVNLRPYGWRVGKVVLVVPAGRSVRREARRLGVSVRNFGAESPVRDHESYVVRGEGGGLYHPSVWRIEKNALDKAIENDIAKCQKVANAVARDILIGMGLKKDKAELKVKPKKGVEAYMENEIDKGLERFGKSLVVAAKGIFAGQDKKGGGK